MEEFWDPLETTVRTFNEAMQEIHKLFDLRAKKKTLFTWRGQADASWGLDSSLYRRLRNRSKRAVTENDLQAEEKRVLVSAHQWGLHFGERGRLSVLNQLAWLQHYGAPTRMIDVTFNPLIGLWFAVEERGNISEHADGRLFAVDVQGRLINEDRAKRAWEDDVRRPWPRPDQKHDLLEWTSSVLAWRPPHIDPRIAAQNGAFLLGGVPTSRSPSGPNQWRKGRGNSYWRIEDVRRAMSIPLRFYRFGEKKKGKDPRSPAYTIRIKAEAKPEIRKRLEDLYGYRHSAIYPDVTGFAQHGYPGVR